MLIYGISTQNEVLECESLKSLGDLYLHKAMMKKQKAENFNGAYALYKELLGIYKTKDEKEIVQRRIRYAEKCTNLVYNEKGSKQRTKQPVNITLAVSMTLEEVEEKTKMKGHGLMPLIESYTDLFVKALVGGNKLLEIECLKSLGDLYLDNGRVGKEEAAFTKSAGLYRAALDRCEDSDGRETLKHRIEYMEEVKEHTAKKAKKLQERQPTGQTLVPDNKWLASPSNLTNETSDVISAGNYGGVFKHHLQEGSRALETGDLDSAERNFAAALKSVHVKGEHWKEVEPLCKLSDVYMARGMQSKGGGDFTKAAALCNAALVRSKAANGDGIKQRIQKLTQSFVNEVLGIKHMVPFDDVENHKSVLKANRSYVTGEINRIEQQIDPYSLDDNDPRMKEVEKKRVEAIKTLFETIVHQRRTFIAGLV